MSARIILFIAASLLSSSVFAQRPVNPLSSSPLQAEAVQAFINLLSGVRNATPQSSAAKSQALRMFNELYVTGDQAQQDLLATFVSQLQQLLNKKIIMPRVKERRIMLLLEETKHLLNQMRTQNNYDNPDETPLATKFAQELYTAVNPVLSDFFRFSGMAIGGLTLIGISAYSVLQWSRFISLMREVQKGKGTLGKISHEAGLLLEASRKSDSDLSLSNEIALTLQDLRASPAEAKSILAKTLSELAFVLKEGRKNPGEASFSEELALSLKALRKQVDLNDPESTKNLTLLQGLLAGINTMMAEDHKEVTRYAKKAANWLKANPDKTIDNLPENCKVPAGTLRRIVTILEMLNVKPNKMESVLHQGIYGLGYSLQELGINLETERRDFPDGDVPPGTTSRIVALIETLGVERALKVLEWWFEKEKGK